VERGSEIADSGPVGESTEAAELLIEGGVAMNGSEDEVVAVSGGVKSGSEGVFGLVLLDAAGPWVSSRSNWS